MDKIIELYTEVLKPAPYLMTRGQAAKYSPIGQKQLREIVKTGEIRSIKYQNKTLILKQDLLDYLVATHNIKKQFGFEKKRGEQ